MLRNDLVCFGEVLYDVYDTKTVLAGAPLNVASIGSQIGLRTGLISAISNRKADSLIVKELKKRGVMTVLQRNKHSTGKAIIKLNKDKMPVFKIDDESAFDYIKYTPHISRMIKRTDYIYFGTLCQRSKLSRYTLFDILKSTDAKVIYDMNLRESIPGWKASVMDSIMLADILKVNEEELKVLRDMFKCRNVAQFLFTHTKIKYIFVTKGAKGASVFRKNKLKLSVKSPIVGVIDTTGCGDAFTAAIVAGFKKKYPAKRILEYAVKVASETARHKGAFKRRKD